MIQFIDDQRGTHGVEPICKVLPIAPSTYHDHVAKRADPEKCSARAKRDMVLKPEITRVFKENFEVYGVRKVWRQLQRETFDVARCTVERLMQSMGLQGVIRGKPVRTTFSDKAASCPLDHVNRKFHAPAPNRLWVSDFTYVSTWAGMVYVAFVIDVYARYIVGWRVSRTAMPALCWMRSSRLFMTGSPSIKLALSTTRIAAASISRSNIPSDWQRLASSPPSAVSETPMTMPSPKPSTVFTRLK
jgi:HTH-like domain/Integrase core domain